LEELFSAEYLQFFQAIILIPENLQLFVESGRYTSGGTAFSQRVSMPRLQELIINLGLASVGELNRAIFAYPDSGLLDAIEQNFGAEKAAEIRLQISSATNVPLLADDELRIEDSVLNQVSALELAPLVTKYKAVPLRLIQDGNADALLLAMSDPLLEEAKTSYAQLYRLPVKTYLARERSVMNAYALAAAKVSLAARREAAEHADGHLPSFAKHVEDPEVKKAIQQLTATAVKHGASLVELDTRNAFTKAQFTFADGLMSSVEISVSPTAVVASFIRRGQVVSEDERSIQASCRVRFKSVSVNFQVNCVRSEDLPATLPDGVSAELACRKISLSNFTIDNPDNPTFWESLHPGNADALRALFEHDSGLFFIVGSRNYSREFALRALRESYSDILALELRGEIAGRNDIFEQAQQHRLAVTWDRADCVESLSQMTRLQPSQLEYIRGIVAFQQVPRICPFCAEHTVPETDLLVRIPQGVTLTKKEFRSGKGCSVCDGRGLLGFVGVSSVLDMDGYAGKVIRNGGSFQAVVEALTKDCFTPLLEDGLRAAGQGKVRLAQVLQEVSPPQTEYFSARNATAGKIAPRPEHLENAEFQPQLKKTKSTASDKLSADEPLRGAAAFLSRPKTAAAESRIEDWLQPPDVRGENGTPKQAFVGKNSQRFLPADGPALLLVIDDDADQRSILRRVFEIAGYKVEVAADGIDGIVSAVRLEPRLIIVDFMMPELDGRETIRRLKNGPTTGTIPIVALTAYADPDVELGLLQAGADDFCPKSVSKQVLLKRVERLLGQ
jgi:CheY-like chemotaxis protein